MKRIAVTDTGKPSYEKYVEWLKRIVPIETVKISFSLKNGDELNTCDGVLLTGGQDVHPKFYGKPEVIELLDEKDIDEYRDEFELETFARARNNGLPVLAICRGLQVANVAMGGTLFPDLIQAGFSNHRLDANDEERHSIRLSPESMLNRVTKKEEGRINSRHHQAVDILGTGLSVSGRSDDGVVEAIELTHQNSSPFFLAVQWHPERMNDFENPFSKNILERFILATSQFHQ